MNIISKCAAVAIISAISQSPVLANSNDCPENTPRTPQFGITETKQCQIGDTIDLIRAFVIRFAVAKCTKDGWQTLRVADGKNITSLSGGILIRLNRIGDGELRYHCHYRNPNN